MNTSSSSTRRSQEILEQMGQIPVIVQGKLSERRTAGKCTGHKLQRWRNGHNETRHVPLEKVETVRQGTEGYRRFTELVQNYVQAREEEALGDEPGAKKKPMNR